MAVVVRERRPGPVRGFLSTLAGAVIAVALLAAPAGAYVAAVTVARAPAGRPVPAGFLGLALEYRSIPGLVGSDPAAVDPVFVGLIRNLVPAGRPVIRVGGQSTDRTWWPVAGMTRPPGITYDLGPAWLAAAHALAVATNARMILGVGLEADRSRIDAVEAAHLVAGVGRAYVDSLELGNEPELYTAVPWYRTAGGHPVPWYENTGAPVYARRTGYGPGAFLQEVSRTLAALPSAVPVAGPATGLEPWLAAFAARYVSPVSRVRTITWHAYGLNQCVTDPSSGLFPSIPNLLAPGGSRRLLDGVSPFVGSAHRAGVRFRIAEMGSVTCNPGAGVSNTFAAALWAPDALFTAAAGGVDGVNLHTYEHLANGLFDLRHSANGWEGSVHPLYYGALMFAHAAPPGSRLLPARSSDTAALRAWATRGPDRRTRVLLINDSLTASALAVVGAAGRGAASLERLRAPSVNATTGVTLGGQGFGAATGSGLLPPARLEAVARTAGDYRVTLPAASAALLTFASG